MTILLLRLFFNFVSIEKIHQTLKTVFHQLSKHLKFRQKYSATCHIFNSLLDVWIPRWDSLSCFIYYINTLDRQSVGTRSIPYHHLIDILFAQIIVADLPLPLFLTLGRLLTQLSINCLLRCWLRCWSRADWGYQWKLDRRFL